MKLVSLCQLIADCPHSTPIWTKAGVLVLRSNNIRNGRLVWNSKSYTDEAHFRGRVRRAEPTAGDLVLTREAPMGEVCMIPTGLRCCLGQRMVLLRPDVHKVNSRFLLYALQSAYVQNQIRSYEGTGSTVSNLRIPALESLLIPLPERSTQDLAATLLGALDDRIDVFEDQVGTLKTIAAAIFRSWFVDFDPVHAKAEGREPEGMDAETAALFPSAIDHDLPVGFKRSSVGEIATVVDCLHSKKPKRVGGSNHPLLQLANIRNDGLVDMEDTYGITHTDYCKWITRMEARGDDCVITNVGRIGAVAQIPFNLKAALGRNMTGIRLKPEFPYPAFLISTLTSDSMRLEIQSRTDAGTILNALNVRSIPLLKLVLPPGQLLSRFEEVVRPLRQQMELKLLLARTLTQLRDTLLPRLISGTLRVPEAEKLVALAL